VNHKIVRIAAVCAAALLLDACGGGTSAPASDGSSSPLPGFDDPPAPGLTGWPSSLQIYHRPDFTPSMLLDSSGRFVVLIQNGLLAQDVIMGTMSVAGRQWTSAGASHAHRAAGQSSAATGTVDLSAVLGSVPDANGLTEMKFTFSNATAPLVTSEFTGWWGAVGVREGGPFVLPPIPDGSYFNDYRIRIDGNTGRVRGSIAEDCMIEGVMAMSDPQRNVYRLRAALSGVGCASARLPVGTGELLGSWQPSYVGVPSGWTFSGLVEGQPAQLFIGPGFPPV